MICQKCNFQNEGTAKFCGNCGAELIKQQPKFHKKTKKRNYLWILGGILVITISVVLMLFNLTPKIQLPETITISDGEDYNTCYKYTYDEQNRITKILVYEDGNLESIYMLYYDAGGDLVKEIEERSGRGTNTKNYAKIGNKIKITETMESGGYKFDMAGGTINLDNDGYPIKKESGKLPSSGIIETYYFEGGNMTKRSFKSREEYQERYYCKNDYKYDGNKAMFYYCETPKWYLFAEAPYPISGSINNVIESRDSDNEGADDRFFYKYKYDKAGFPTKITETEIEGENKTEIKHIVTYTYK